MKNIKKELIIALKYICPKFGYSFLCLGVALVLVLPAKMADILFASPGNILFTLAVACPTIWILRDLMGDPRLKAKNRRLLERITTLEAEKKELEAKISTLEKHGQNPCNIIANGDNSHPKAVVTSVDSPTQSKKPFDFEAEYEESADEQIPEPAEETNLQESSDF